MSDARLTPEFRYLHDPVSHVLVDRLLEAIRNHDITPTELREAAVLAAAMHDAETARPLLLNGYRRPIGRSDR